MRLDESLEAPREALTSLSTVSSGTFDLMQFLQHRLDWRFLLPSPQLTDVAFAGPSGSKLLAALRGAAEVCLQIRGAPCRHKVVVASSISWGDLEPTWNAVAPGGWLYLELDKRKPGLKPSGWSGFRKLLTRLRELGASPDPVLHLHWPGFADRKSIVPLRQPEPLAYLIRQRLPGFQRWPESVPRWLSRINAPLWADCFSLLAHKPNPTAANPEPDDLADRLIRPLPSRPPGLELTLLTPRFKTSRHLIVLAFSRGDPEPMVVAKLPRRSTDGNELQQEARHLKRIHEIFPGAGDSVPRVLAMDSYHGRPLLIESALGGPLLAPARLAAARDRYCRQVTSWLSQFHAALRSEHETSPFDLLLPSWNTLRRALPDCELLEATKTRLASLPDRLPSVYEHGDLSHPNLVDMDRGIGILDWESARFPGLPAVDLFFFLAFAARSASDRALMRQPLQHRLQRAFAPSEGWAIPYLKRYLETLQLDSRALPGLFAATWVRALSRLLEVLDVPVPVGDRNWLFNHPHWTCWEFAVQWEGL